MQISEEQYDYNEYKWLKHEDDIIDYLIEDCDILKVYRGFLKTNNVYIELIEPADPDSPIISFVKEGGGFHHLCFEVDDIQQEIDKMVKKGAHLVVAPVKGFENRLIAFLMLNMKKTKCNLIELVEAKNN